MEMHQTRETTRVRGTPGVENYFEEKVCEIFDIGYSVGHCTYRNMNQILYPKLDLSCLPPPKKNLNKFLNDIGEVGSYRFSKFVIPY